MHINGTNLGLNYQNFFDESYFFLNLIMYGDGQHGKEHG